jgi:hypothetical protein
MISFLQFIFESNVKSVKWVYHPSTGAKSGESSATHPLEHADLQRSSLYDETHKGRAFIKNGTAHTWWQEHRTAEHAHTMNHKAVEHDLKRNHGAKRVAWHPDGISATKAL